MSQYFLAYGLFDMRELSLVLDVVGSRRLNDASNLIGLSDQPQPKSCGGTNICVYIPLYHPPGKHYFCL